MGNQLYTQLWTENFSESDAQRYDKKFKIRWEKNIKHRAQIAFVKKYLDYSMYWCDCPIGSGRLMNELSTKKMLGYDVSDQFLDFNRKRGINCVKGDIFEFGNTFPATFDFVTSLHTIFAFKEYQNILQGFVKSLKGGGILVVDIVNKEHATSWANVKALILKDVTEYSDGMSRDEIESFFGALECDVLEIQAHDYWDNYAILQWRHYRGNLITKKLKKYFWKVINFLYFKFHLYRIFRKYEINRPDYLFTKYLVAIRKR